MTPKTRSTDFDVLRGEAYADSKNLEDRRGIYSFRVEPNDIVAWVLDAVPLPPGGRALDLGCGPGQYLRGLAEAEPSLRLVGADLSPGMVREARAAVPSATYLNLDACRLPFADDAFDVVLANHMLYHVTDIEGAAREVRRVLRPGGVFSALTNSERHFAELDALLADVSGGEHWFRSAQRFKVENGQAQLEAGFDEIAVRASVGELRVPTPGPVVQYVRSMRALSLAAEALDDAGWEELVAEVERRVTAEIEREGAFSITASSGAFVCR